jgi:hypothetical protein
MSTFNRATLAKVLEILGSDHAGEALAAAKLASTMVREAGLTWDEVLSQDIRPHPSGPYPNQPGPGGGGGGGGNRTTSQGPGPFGYRRDRDLSPHEQFFMVLLSPRTPNDIKRKLRGWEARVLDGEITPQEKQDLRFMYQSFVA